MLIGDLPFPRWGMKESRLGGGREREREGLDWEGRLGTEYKINR